MDYPSAHNSYLVEHASYLSNSYQQLLGRSLFSPDTKPSQIGKALFHAPFAVVSHDTTAEPIFNYANLTALQLFAMDWSEFIQLPSRLSAELVNQAERATLLAQVTRQGFIDNYQGVRIAKNGQRFMIKNAVVWNLFDAEGKPYGQAACFAEWQFL